MKRIKKCANFGGIFTSTISPVINGIGGVLDDTLSKQGVNQFKIDDPNTETDNTVVMRCGGKARPKCWLGAAIGATTSLASGLIGGAASRKSARKAAALRNRQTMIQDMQGRDKQLNALYSTYLNNNDNEEDLIYRRGGTATQHPRRRMFAKGGKYNFTNFANRLERNVNESDNTRVASGRRVVNARNRQYRRDNSLIGKVINYKSDRVSQIKRKGTLTAQQYRNSKSAQTFGQYDRVNYNGKTYYVPQVQGGIAPGVSVRNPAQILQGVQNANKIRQAANASKATQAVKQSAKVEGSNVMKYVQQRANPFSNFNFTNRTSPYAGLRRELGMRGKSTFTKVEKVARKQNIINTKKAVAEASVDKAAEATKKAAQKIQRKANEAAERVKQAQSQKAARARRNQRLKSQKISVNGNTSTGTVNGGRIKPRQAAEQPTRSNGNTVIGTIVDGKVQPIQPGTPYSTVQPAFSDAPVAPNVPTTHVAPINPATPASSTTQAKSIYDIIKNTKAYKTLYRLSKSEDFPKVVGYTALGVPLALGSAYGAYKLLNNTNNSKSNNINNKTNFNKSANNPKAKAQSQQVSNTTQVANQTPNDSIIIKDKVQPGEVVHRDSIYKANDGESYVKVGDKTGNTWVNIKNVPANTPAVSNNKTTDSRNLGKSQTQQTKAAAQTIQRKGRAKSRVVSNRTNNIRQNINFEPIDDTINGYSQVEDIQGRTYDEYKADVDAEAEARRQEIINDLLNNYNYEDRNTTDEMRYGGKARSKRRVPIKITDGGIAQRIGNNTFLLRGSSHEQINPSGQTGIGIKVGNNEIEAEGGEVAQRVGNALRIFSAQPMINGVSPAQAVEAGANKNRIFAIQEALKRKGYKCGGRVKLKCGGRAKLKPGGKVNPIFKYNDYAGIEDLPNSNTGISSGTYNNGNLSLGQAEKTIFPKGFVSHDSNNIGSSKTDSAPIDNWWNRNGMSVNSSDWIGLGTDLAGSLALGAFNANAYKNLKYDYKLPNYVDEIPVAFDTTYHNGAQRATVERNRINAQKIIANNTSSANTAVQRMQQSNADAMMETNKLWDEKANKEVELRNMAAQNEQQVRARNAAARNQYYQNVAEIQNKRIDAENANRLARSNAWSTSLQGLQGAANNFLNSTRQRYEDENALMATIAAGDAATPYRMMAFGTQFGPRVINAVRAMNNVEGMKYPGAAPIRSNYSNDADYSTARSKWEAAMKNYEYWKQRNQFLSNYDNRGRLIRRR